MVLNGRLDFLREGVILRIWRLFLLLKVLVYGSKRDYIKFDKNLGYWV